MRVLPFRGRMIGSSIRLLLLMGANSTELSSTRPLKPVRPARVGSPWPLNQWPSL